MIIDSISYEDVQLKNLPRYVIHLPQLATNEALMGHTKDLTLENYSVVSCACSYHTRIFTNCKININRVLLKDLCYRHLALTIWWTCILAQTDKC